MAVGRVALTSRATAINQDLKALYPSKQLDAAYLLRVLALLRPRLEAVAVGSTVKGIRLDQLLAQPIDLPPLPEQRRIAEVLNTVDEVIQQTEALIAKLKHMKRGLLHDLLTRGLDENGEMRDPVTHPEQFKDWSLGRIPREWEVSGLASRRRGDIPHLKTGPFGSSLKGEHWADEGVPVITIGALGEGEFTRSELLFVSERTATALAAYTLQPGDIVFSRVADVGRSVVITDAEAGWIMSSNLMRITLDQGQADPFFVRAMIVHAAGVKQQIRQFINAGGREVANTGILDSVLFAWPSIEEQNRIVSAIVAHDSLIRTEEAYRDKLRLLKEGLMQDLLTGRVRVPMPEPEPELIEAGA